MKVLATGLAALVFAALPVLAQDVDLYPERPVTVVVPYAPGGSTDAAARLIGPLLDRALGQPFVVDNRPGAAGVLGTQHVANATPDGYTVLVHTSVIGIHPAFHPDLPYDTEEALVPVGILSGGPFVLVANPELRVDTMQELVEYATAHPDTLSFGSAGIGSSGHLIGELFKSGTDIEAEHIPYGGGAPSQIGLMGNEVQFVFDSLTSLPMINEGKMKALAVTSAERWPGLPDVPTVAEAGFSKLETLIWVGAFVPRNTPGEIVEKLSRGLSDAINDDTLRQRLMDVGMVPIGSSPAEAAQMLRDDIAKWRDLSGSVDIDM